MCWALAQPWLRGARLGFVFLAASLSLVGIGFWATLHLPVHSMLKSLLFLLWLGVVFIGWSYLVLALACATGSCL